MKNPKIVTLLVILVSLGIVGVAHYVVTNNILWKVIGNQLDRERFKDVGEYNVLEWNDGLFQIRHFMAMDTLQMSSDDTTVVLLENVYDYKNRDGRLYIVSEWGYAVIDENDNASILITYYTELDKKNLQYEVDRNGQKIVYSKRYEDEHITYLTSFIQFSEKDQKRLESMSD